MGRIFRERSLIRTAADFTGNGYGIKTRAEHKCSALVFGIHAKENPNLFKRSGVWLRNKDSNLDKQCQRLSCYHYTIPQYRRERYYYIEFSAFVKGVLKQILPEIKKNIHSYRLTSANLIFFCQSLASIAKDKMTARRAIAFRAAVA